MSKAKEAIREDGELFINSLAQWRTEIFKKW